MTYHPGLPHDAGPWDTYYDTRPPLLDHDSNSTANISMGPIEEGEEELEPKVTAANRPQRKTRAPIPLDPSLRTAASTSGNVRGNKGKSRTNRPRSRSTSILNPAHNIGSEAGSTAVFLPDPYQPAIQLKGLSKNGLLPAPPGCILDVNDLLILHPPEKENSALQGHTSQFEMYTCRVCSKTYDGKNARSVARRHLQDKHGVPLSVQKRRSRWDYEPDRPKSQEDAKERNLKSKREWINKYRQIQRLEKSHEAFLERFGPSGIITPCGMNLVAPMFKGEVEATNQKNRRYLDGTQGNLIIPESILKGIEAIKDLKSAAKSSADLAHNEEEPDISVDMREGKVVIKKGKNKKKGTTAHKTSSQPVDIARSHTPFNTIPNNGSPARYYDQPIGTSTPTSSARNVAEQPPQLYPWQPLQPAQMTVIDGQYHFSFQPDYPQYAHHAYPVTMVPMEDDSLPSSPEELHALPDQQWVPSDSWSSTHSQQQQLEPALDITQQWQGLQLSSWPAQEEDQTMTQEAKEGSVETEGEAVAAESLLSLHSTPLRGPDENGRNDIQLARAQASLNLVTRVIDQVREADAAPQQGKVWSSQLLSAPSIESPTRPRPQRSSSFIQPFRDPRPEVTRSLSFDARPNLEDPFVLATTPARPASANGSNKPTPTSTSNKRGKRHTISLPSPSPLSTSCLAIKKRKQAPTSPAPAAIAPASVTRSALRPLSTNIKPNYAGSFATPIKPSSNATNLPQSVTQEWLQFSSPNNADAATSLGLVPTHFVPTTPGLRGMIGAETPEMTILEARAKKRRSEGGASTGKGLRR
ncbi:uncharacterized protein I303_104897 [Kwoniella dejecticola CBS 10117]|uniref:Uncharacterized protein n=1 Tax=Kwoniella dejecticola CBS 10117 TaxID=1296121 RepID=A0A1A6A416_9TREE|nr:uncharacterized protein I303_05657 [Kwoniella dejecticola CBS 10117]OBR84798.1 hypothetical protein I303_05657 [Kwoniella dejecticola CBS 10117]